MNTPNHGRYHLMIATLVSGLGGLLFGYDNIVISGAIDYLSRFYHLDAVEIGWAAGCAMIGCLVGSASIGVFADRVGLKKSLYVCAACFGASSAGILFAGTFTQFVLWRLIGGVGIGAASIVAPMYIAEIAPTRIRGRLVTLYQLGIVLGILAAVFVNVRIRGLGDEAWNVASGWRWMFFAGLAPALLFFWMIVPAPESPRWLLKRGRLQEGLAVLCCIGSPNTAAAEARQIQQSLQQERGGVDELFSSRFRRTLLIGLMLAGLSQTSGITPVFSYLPEIFKAAGTHASDAFFQTVLVSMLNLVFTLVALWLVDLAGRKTLILIGTTFQTLSFAWVGWLYASAGSGLGVLGGVMGFVAAHAVGNGAVCWVIISEIYPNKVRGVAMSIATTALWAFAYLGNQAFPLMQKHLGNAGTFWCFGAAALLNFVLVLLLVPETKGRSLEQIEEIWAGSAPVRQREKEIA